jgi:RNA polymerase sigma factor (sigma-70 family)
VHDSDVSVPAVPEASIPGVADDAAILNQAYDSYADALYAYCRSLVQEPAAAADAVRDTFVVAAFRLADVPDESLLRPWMFAVARNECLRAISSAAATEARGIFPDGDEAASADSPAAAGDLLASAADGSGEARVSGDLDDARASALPRAAIGGLDAVERDFIVLAWHGLDITECADVLGIARDEAFRLLFRARDQLEASAGVLVVAGSGWRECAALTTVIAGWDGRLTSALRQELRQHIDRCDVCGDQRRRGLPPSVLLRMAPDAMRGLATTPDTLRRAAWVTSRLKDRVLAAAFDQELDSFEHRAMVVRRAAPFRGDGFPVPLDPPGAAPRGKRRSRMPLAVVGLAGTGLVAVLVVVAVALSGQHSTGSGALPTRMSLSQPSAASPGTGPSAEGGGSGHAASPASPEASASSSASPSASSSPTAKPSSAPATPKPSNAAAQGGPAVAVSPTSLTLNWYPQYGVYGGEITLTNTTSSTVNWSVTLPADLHIGGFHAQSSGSLSPGQKASVIIYAQRDGSRPGGGTNGSRTEAVTLYPGNVQVAVTIPGR